MYTKILEQIGLNPSEAQAYEAMIALGNATPAQLAVRAKLTRANAYFILPRLESMGLVIRLPDSKRASYAVTSPDILIELLNRQLAAVSDTKQELRKVIKQIEPKINVVHNKPLVRYFQGKEGIRQAYKSFLDTSQKKVWQGFIHRTNDPEFLRWLEDMIIAERVKKGIFLNLIVTDQVSGRRLIDRKQEEKREVKIIESISFPTGTYIIVDGERVLLLTRQTGEDDTIGLIIDHPQIAKGIKAMFDLLWDKAR